MQIKYIPFIILSLILGTLALGIAVGDQLPSITLKGEEGGRVDGTPWSSKTLTGKVHLVFYVDPDKKSDNEAMEAALQQAAFPKNKVASVAVINMAATWLPNAAINSSLKAKQKKFPNTTYVRDLDKALVDKWKLADDSYVVLAMDQQGEIFFHEKGQLDKEKINTLLREIRKRTEGL